jgi:hypothetical protein
MAKKTNYLTELIDRHERWKAEGGERIEEEELHPDIVELYVNIKCFPVDRLLFDLEMASRPKSCGISVQSAMGDERLEKVQSKYLDLLLRGKTMIYHDIEVLTILTSLYQLAERKHPHLQHQYLLQREAISCQLLLLHPLQSNDLNKILSDMPRCKVRRVIEFNQMLPTMLHLRETTEPPKGSLQMNMRIMTTNT